MAVGVVAANTRRRWAARAEAWRGAGASTFVLACILAPTMIGVAAHPALPEKYQPSPTSRGECSLFKDDGTLSGKMGTLVPIPCLEDIVIKSAWGAAHSAAAGKEAATYVAKCFQCIPRPPSGGTASESRGTVGRSESRNNSRGGSSDDDGHRLESGDAHVKKALLKSREGASSSRHRSRPHSPANVGKGETSGRSVGGGEKDNSEVALALPSDGIFPLSVSAEPSDERPASGNGGGGGAGAAFATGVAAALVGTMLSSAASAAGSADDAGATDRAVAGCNNNCGGGAAKVLFNESDEGRVGSGSGRSRGPGGLREWSDPSLRGAQVEEKVGGIGRKGAVEGGAKRSQTLDGVKNALDDTGGNFRGDSPEKTVHAIPPHARSRDESLVHVPERHVGQGAVVEARGADGRTAASDNMGAKKPFIKRGISSSGVGGGVSAARESGDENDVVVSEFYEVHPLSGKEYEAAVAERDLQAVPSSAPTGTPSVTETPIGTGTNEPSAVEATPSPTNPGSEVTSEPVTPGTPTPAPSAVSGTPPTLSPGETSAPGDRPSPTATPQPTAVDDRAITPTSPNSDPTPAPIPEIVDRETLDEAADATTGAVAVAVASTVAAVTVTSVTTSTAAATTAAATSAATTTAGVVTTSGAAGGSGGAGGGAAAGGSVAATNTIGAGGATAPTTAGGSGAAGTTAGPAGEVAAVTSATTTTTTGATGVTGGTTGVVSTGGTSTGTGMPDSARVRSGANTNSTGSKTNADTSNAYSSQGAAGGTEQTDMAARSIVDPGTTSSRSPSATLGLLMIFQMQFLSMLRLLEANISEPFRKLLDNLKWLNLHFDTDIAGWVSCDDEDSEFSWSNNDNGVWLLNTFVVFGFLLTLIMFHILLLSYLEAKWLAQANAIHRSRLQRMRERGEENVSPPATYSRWLDSNNLDRDLDEEEALATKRYLQRHNSIWLYFPHVELVFLLFAYQGASAAEARMLLSGCWPLVVLGAIAMFVFPALMIFYVSRIVWNRVRPHHGPVDFEQRWPDESERPRGSCAVKICRGMCHGWRTGESMFEWADKGAWKCRTSEEEDFDGRKFRIGFEPLFVDFTRDGAVYIVFLLFKWFALGIIAGVLHDGRAQTTALFVIYVVDIILLVTLRPFSNSFIQWVEVILVVADTVTLGLMVYASFLITSIGSEMKTIDTIYLACMLIQTLAIMFITILIYIDTFFVLSYQIRSRAKKLLTGERKDTEAKPRKVHVGCGEVCRIFCTLVRENCVGCVKATVYGPRSSAARDFSSRTQGFYKGSRGLYSVAEEKEIDSSSLFASIRKPVVAREHPVKDHLRPSRGRDLESGQSSGEGLTTTGGNSSGRRGGGRGQRGWEAGGSGAGWFYHSNDHNSDNDKVDGDLDDDFDDGDGDTQAERQYRAGLRAAARTRQFGHYRQAHPASLSPSSTSIGRARAPPAYDQMLPPSPGEVDSMSYMYDQASEAAAARGRSVGGSVDSFGFSDEGRERGQLRHRRTMTPDDSGERLTPTSLRQRRRGGGRSGGSASRYPGYAEEQDQHHRDHSSYGGAEGGGRYRATTPRESGSRRSLSAIRQGSSSPEGEGDGGHDGDVPLGRRSSGRKLAALRPVSSSPESDGDGRHRGMTPVGSGGSSRKLSSIRPVSSSPEHDFDVDYRPWHADEDHDRDGFSSGDSDGGDGRHAGSRRRRGRRFHADEDYALSDFSDMLRHVIGRPPRARRVVPRVHATDDSPSDDSPENQQQESRPSESPRAGEGSHDLS